MAGTPNAPGSVLAGRFTLEDLLDEDGGARFWRATDRTLARSVAVHVLPDSDPRADPLLAAARCSALVSDPRLLRVLDAASTDGVVYVVNEWGSGVSLDRLLAEGPLSPRRAAWVVREVAESITTAHRNGVAHGRLLPENVMVSESGAVKVIGFVIDAVLRPGAAHRAASGPWPRLVTGGEPVSPHESDVLNLAGLLYAALVGRWPGTEGSTIPPAPAEHGRPLRPRQVRAGVPRPLDAICDRVLGGGSHHQQDPIETAHEILAALGDFLGDSVADLVLGAGGSTAVGSSEGTGSGATAGAATDSRDSSWEVDTGEIPATGTHEPPAKRPGRVPAGRGRAVVDRSGDPDATQAVPVPDYAGRGGSAPPARPLFAEDRPAATAPRPPSRATDSDSFTGEQRSTGAGNGRLPAGWGPDPDPGRAGTDDDWDTGGHDRAVPGRTWLRLAVVLGVLVSLVVAVVLAFTIGRNGSGGEAASASQSSGTASRAAKPATVPVAIAGVRDFDPQASPPEENPELAPLAIDGNPGTAWRTSTYYDPLERVKPGVGLLVDLGRPTTVGEVRLTLLGTSTPDRPTALEILAAPDATTAPTSTVGLAEVASDDDAGDNVDLALAKKVTTRWVVVWFTRLPTVPGGFQGRVAEISLRS